MWSYEPRFDSGTVPVCEKSEHRFPVPPHLHCGIEIIYVIKGSLTAVVLSGGEELAELAAVPGEALLFGSNTVHMTKEFSADCVHYVAHIPPNCLPGQAIPPPGTAYLRPAKDRDCVLRGLLAHMERLSSEHSDAEGVLLSSLAAPAVMLLRRWLEDSAAEVRAELCEIDMINYIVRDFRNPELSQNRLTEMFGYSPKRLSELFTARFGMNVRAYVNRLRIEDAKYRLLDTGESVETVGRTVGYDCQRTFLRVFREQTGMTPTEYRQNAEAKQNVERRTLT